MPLLVLLRKYLSNTCMHRISGCSKTRRGKTYSINSSSWPITVLWLWKTTAWWAERPKYRKPSVIKWLNWVWKWASLWWALMIGRLNQRWQRVIKFGVKNFWKLAERPWKWPNAPMQNGWPLCPVIFTGNSRWVFKRPTSSKVSAVLVISLSRIIWPWFWSHWAIILIYFWGIQTKLIWFVRPSIALRAKFCLICGICNAMRAAWRTTWIYVGMRLPTFKLAMSQAATSQLRARSIISFCSSIFTKKPRQITKLSYWGWNTAMLSKARKANKN